MMVLWLYGIQIYLLDNLNLVDKLDKIIENPPNPIKLKRICNLVLVTIEHKNLANMMSKLN